MRSLTSVPTLNCPYVIGLRLFRGPRGRTAKGEEILEKIRRTYRYYGGQVARCCACTIGAVETSGNIVAKSAPRIGEVITEQYDTPLPGCWPTLAPRSSLMVCRSI